MIPQTKPQTEEEWLAERVLPLYLEWEAKIARGEPDDDDFIPDELIQAFLRGEITDDELREMVGEGE